MTNAEIQMGIQKINGAFVLKFLRNNVGERSTRARPSTSKKYGDLCEFNEMNW